MTHTIKPLRSRMTAPLLAILLVLTVVSSAAGGTIFFNELHYDNVGTDAGEAIEIAGPAGFDLTGWAIWLYNGSGGASYNSLSLSGILPNQQNGYGTAYFVFVPPQIQNGGPDGLALVDPSSVVVQFLSYEGTFVATDGPANGMLSTDIGVAEFGSEPLGLSLQLSGVGTAYSDFAWGAPLAETFGEVNANQTFVPEPSMFVPVVLALSGLLLAGRRRRRA